MEIRRESYKHNFAMVKCSACDGDVKSKDNVVICSISSCKLQYHQACVGVKRGTNISASTWVCPECKIKQMRRGDNSDTPVKETDDRKRTQNPVHSSSSSSNETKPDDIIRNIKAEIEIVFNRELPKFLAKLMETVTEVIQNKFLELESAVATCSGLYDTVRGTADKNSAAIKKLQTDNNNLSSQIKVLQAKVNSMEEASLKQEQWSRLQNIEIVGVPESNDENLPSVMENIAKHLNVSLAPQDLDFVHRVQAKRQVKGKLRNIIVRFQNRIKKDALLSAARKSGGITSRDIGMKDEHKTIYINEHLTVKNKQLLNNCKAKAKECGYKFVWTKNCRIYTRKAENLPFILISCEEDLKKVV